MPTVPMKTLTIGGTTLKIVDGDMRMSIVTPEMFGAVGNGLTDDTQAMQDAFEAAQHVVLDGSKTYYCAGTLVILDGTTLDMNGATIAGPDTADGLWQIFNFYEDDVYTGYSGNGNITIRNGRFLRSTISFIHGKDTVIENCRFEDARRSHFIEICASQNFIVRDCSFKGMTLNYTPAQAEYINIDNAIQSHFPHAPETSPMFDGTPNDGILIDNCVFDRNSTTMWDAVGKHARYSAEYPTLNRAKDITIRNCTVYGATEEAFLFRGAEDVTIENCKAYNSAALYWVQNCDDVKICNNHIAEQTGVNRVRDCNRVMINGNYVKVNASTWDVQLQYTCSYIDYSGNYFVNTYNYRLPVSLMDGATITEFSAVGNVYRVNGGHNGVLAHPANDSGCTITFGMVDDIHFVEAQNEFTATYPIFDLTNFNRMIIQVGAVPYYTLSTVVISALQESSSSHFQVGDKFWIPVNDLSTGQVGLCSIEITDAHTLTSTGQKIRWVQLQNV